MGDPEKYFAFYCLFFFLQTFLLKTKKSSPTNDSTGAEVYWIQKSILPFIVCFFFFFTNFPFKNQKKSLSAKKKKKKNRKFGFFPLQKKCHLKKKKKKKTVNLVFSHYKKN